MKFLQGLYSQGVVVHALVLRETRTRFGAHDLGYLWALVEPVLMILTFWVLFYFAGRVPPFDMDLVGFITTGLVPFLLFSSTTSRVADSINGNKALLFYPQVMPLSLAVARSVLEVVTYSLVFIAIMGANALWMQQLQVANILMVIAGFALASLLGATFGLVLCALGQYSNAVERARGPLMRPLFWLSGIFFAVASMPSHVREPLLINPLLHTVELVRAGWYPGYPAEFANIGYVLKCVLVLGLVGLVLERKVRRRIEVT